MERERQRERGYSELLLFYIYFLSIVILHISSLISLKILKMTKVYSLRIFKKSVLPKKLVIIASNNDG